MTVFGAGLTSPQSCFGAKCHFPGKEDAIDFSTQANAYRTLVPKAVKAGNPTGSALMTRLTSTDVKRRMPLDKPALDPVVIAKIRAWIVAGALNN
jgi:hypothetical protein